MKRLTLIVAMAAAALTGGAAPARAESGAFIFGGRLAYNYSNILYESTTRSRNGVNNYYSYYSDGGSGFEAGLIGRYAVIEGQMGLNIGVNYVNREPFYMGSKDYAREMAVSVPILFEVSPSTFAGSSIYELMFLQIGPQIDYTFDFNEKSDWGFDPWEREKFGFGLVIGAVGYFNSHCSLDLRYHFAFTGFAKDEKDINLYSGSLGLSFYF